MPLVSEGSFEEDCTAVARRGKRNVCSGIMRELDER